MSRGSVSGPLAVGLLHFTAPPVVGGVEAVVGEHARVLARAGHPVRVIAGRGGRGGADHATVLIPRADARHPAVASVQRTLDAGSVPTGFDGLVEEIARDLRAATAGLDVLVAHNVCSLDVNAPLTAALRLAHDRGDVPPLVAWTHDLSATSARYLGRLHPGAPWDLFREAWPGVVQVAISASRRDDVARVTGLLRHDIHVVRNGIDRAGFLDLAPESRRLVARLDLESAGPVLLTPARVTPRKNLELVVDVVAALRRGGHDARGIITGAPDPHDAAALAWIDDLRRRAAAPDVAGAIHLLADLAPRHRSRRLIRDLFRVADVLFLPSRDEGFGLPVLEAAVARLPVVCADLPALRELAGTDAIYIDPDGDPSTIADRMRGRLEGDPGYRLARRVRAELGWSELLRASIGPVLREAAARGR